MNLKTAIIVVVNRIPQGQVASYGQVAQVVTSMMPKTISAQLIGWQLSGMPESERGQLPWWRVVSRRGEISSRKLGAKGMIQAQKLIDEGVVVSNYQLDMSQYQVDQEVISF